MGYRTTDIDVLSVKMFRRVIPEEPVGHFECMDFVLVQFEG